MALQLAPGMHLTERLTLVRSLGQGAMGQVWLADDAALECRVAVKFLAFGRERDPNAVARFEREFATAAEIDSHHVVRMLDCGTTREGVPYIVMEHLGGEALERHLERVGSMPLGHALRVVQQVADALDAAHQCGIVHRDIKPDNILLVGGADALRLKVLDFGLAKPWVRQTLTGTGVAMGTPDFMSPEQVLGGRNVDHRSDLWSLGVVTYRMICGHYPFDAATVHALMLVICRGNYTRASKRGAPAELDPWFARALCVDKDERFQSGRQMAADLERAIRAIPGQRREDTATALFRPLDDSVSVDDSAVTPIVDFFAHAASSDSITRTQPIAVDELGTGVERLMTDGASPPDEGGAAEPAAGAESHAVPPSLPVDNEPTTRFRPRHLLVPSPEGDTNGHARAAPAAAGGRGELPDALRSAAARASPEQPPRAAPRASTRASARLGWLAAVAAAIAVGVLLASVLNWRRGAHHRARPAAWDGEAGARPSSGAEAFGGTSADGPSAARAADGGAASAGTTSGDDTTRAAAEGGGGSEHAGEGKRAAGGTGPAAGSEASASVSLRCRPRCRVWVDGLALGSSPVVDHPLRPGRHRVVVYRSPAGSRVLKIDLVPGQHASYDVSMVAPPPDKSGSLAPPATGDSAASSSLESG